MSINIFNQVGALANAPSASYPAGSAKDNTTGPANDGTPLIKEVTNDSFGFFQRLILEAGVTISGVPDTVLASDIYDSLLNIMVREFGSQAVRSFDLVSDMVAATDLNVGDLIVTKGYLSQGVGSALYRVVAVATGTDDGGEFIDLATHQAQLIPENRVKASQYGAVGDGATDDATQLQNLIDAFDVISLDTNSLIATGLTITQAKDVEISKIILATNTVSSIITVSAVGANSVLRFTADARLQGDGVTGAQTGLTLSNTGNVKVLFATVTACLSKSIFLSDASSCLILKALVSGASNTGGIVIQETTTAEKNRIIDCICDGNNFGVELIGGSDNLIDGVSCDSCTDAGIKLTSGASNNTIRNASCNSTSGSPGHGIFIDGQSNDNLLDKVTCNSNAGDGVKVEGSGVGTEVERTRIANATCNINTGDGIALELCLDTEVTDPYCFDNTINGISTLDSNRPVIKGGLLDANGASGLLHQSSLNTLELGVRITSNPNRGILITDAGSFTPESFRVIDCYFFDNYIINIIFQSQVEASGVGLDDIKVINARGALITNTSGNDSISNGGTISHGITETTPVRVNANVGSSGISAAITAIGSSTFTVALFDIATGVAAVGSHTVYWDASSF